jgi:ABC-type nitrate/sulfonate/bicarbonate transport system ATPase subunit
MLDARIETKRLPDGTVLLRDVELTAKPGEIVALLGASGTGKTTTLRILLGLDRAFDGAVHCAAARVGAMFQEPRLLPWCSVAENLTIVARAGAAPPDVAALLREVGLEGNDALFPTQLSLGMARRVALARTLAIAPDLLILDEPFASLDRTAAGSMAACLQGLRRRGVAIVMALHDIELATSLATRIVVLAERPAVVVYRTELASAADRETARADLNARFALAAEAPSVMNLSKDPRP